MDSVLDPPSPNCSATAEWSMNGTNGTNLTLVAHLAASSNFFMYSLQTIFATLSLVAVLEQILPVRDHEVPKRHTYTTTIMGFVITVVYLALMAAPMEFLYSQVIVEYNDFSIVKFLECFFLYELIYQLLHWYAHVNRFVWHHMHAEHHKDENPNVVSAFYATCWENIFGNAGPVVLIFLLNPRELQVIQAVIVFYTFLGLFVHSKLKNSLCDAHYLHHKKKTVEYGFLNCFSMKQCHAILGAYSLYTAYDVAYNGLEITTIIGEELPKFIHAFPV